jgi:hypothetical protein
MPLGRCSTWPTELLQAKQYAKLAKFLEGLAH